MACGPAAPAVPEGPNILLVVIDTLRKDRLPAYGYERPTTPHLDELARDATVFEDAYSVSSWTCPSHASIFTGLYPAAHGVSQEAWTLGPELVTLAEVLREGGYRTAGMVGNPMVGSHFGFHQGFDSFHELWREKRQAEAAAHPAVRHLTELLGQGQERPFFAFVNLIELHSPYLSGPYLETFERHPDIDLHNNHWRAFFSGEVSFEQDQLERLSDLYDGELLFADEIVGNLVRSLEDHGVLEETVVIITSDHGEHFGSHGLVDHVFNLYQGNVTVPLMIRYPPAFPRGARDAGLTQLQDLYSTVLGLAGVAPESGAVHGIDLALEREPGSERELLLSYAFPKQALNAIGSGQDEPALDPYRRRLWARVTGGVKTIVGSDGTVEIYDLATDPGELINLADRPEYAEAAGSAYESMLELVARFARDGNGGSAGEDVSLDAETLEHLRSLGYAE